MLKIAQTINGQQSPSLSKGIKTPKHKEVLQAMIITFTDRFLAGIAMKTPQSLSSSALLSLSLSTQHPLLPILAVLHN